MWVFNWARIEFSLQSKSACFEAFKFYSKCDNKANTLVIVKSTNGNVFDGYALHDSFLLSLINLKKKTIKMNWSKNNQIGIRVCIWFRWG